MDDAGQVKLLDFGIAKLLDVGNEDAGTILRAFTPEYAAPEQIRGEAVTTSVDVYALGVVLYELLTGARPYRPQESETSYEQAVLTREPTRPSTQIARPVARPADQTRLQEIARLRNTTASALRSQLRGDIDAILLKALRKEPAYRYRSVREFAEDIRAALELRPVAARHGGMRYLFGRFVRRNRASVAMAGLAVLALVAGLLASLWQAREARIQRDAAEQALAFMTDLFESADPGTHDDIGLTVRDLLDEGVRNIRYNLLDQGRTRADLLVSMASAYTALSLTEDAEPLLQEASQLMAPGDAIARAKLGIARCALLQARNQSSDCLSIVDEIERSLNPAHPTELNLLLDALGYRLQNLHFADRHEEAASLARRMLALLESSPENLKIRVDVAGGLSYSLQQLGRVEEAEAVMRPLIDELRASTLVPPRVVAVALSDFAIPAGKLGKFQEAVNLQREALAIMEGLYGAGHRHTLTAIGNLATALESANQREEAYLLTQRAVEIGRAHPDFPSKSHAINRLSNAGATAFMLGQDDEALDYLDEAIALSENPDEGVPRYRAIALTWRASTLFALGRTFDARDDLDEAFAIQSGLYPAENPRILRNRALATAHELVERGVTHGACSTVDEIERQYEASSDPAKSASEVAFADFLGDLCVGLSGAFRDPLAVGSSMEKLERTLAPEDFRLRHARVVAHSLAAR